MLHTATKGQGRSLTWSPAADRCVHYSPTSPAHDSRHSLSFFCKCRPNQRPSPQKQQQQQTASPRKKQEKTENNTEQIASSSARDTFQPCVSVWSCRHTNRCWTEPARRTTHEQSIISYLPFVFAIKFHHLHSPAPSASVCNTEQTQTNPQRKVTVSYLLPKVKNLGLTEPKEHLVHFSFFEPAAVTGQKIETENDVDHCVLKTKRYEEAAACRHLGLCAEQDKSTMINNALVIGMCVRGVLSPGGMHRQTLGISTFGWFSHWQQANMEKNPRFVLVGAGMRGLSRNDDEAPVHVR